MESILGIRQGKDQSSMTSMTEEMNLPSREDAKQTDEMAENADRSKRKRGLSRTYFEPVDEDEVRLPSCFCYVEILIFVCL